MGILLILQTTRTGNTASPADHQGWECCYSLGTNRTGNSVNPADHQDWNTVNPANKQDWEY